MVLEHREVPKDLSIIASRLILAKTADQNALRTAGTPFKVPGLSPAPPGRETVSFSQSSFSAASTLSGVAGMRVTRAPVALKIAFRMAGCGASSGASPQPAAP